MVYASDSKSSRLDGSDTRRDSVDQLSMATRRNIERYTYCGDDEQRCSHNGWSPVESGFHLEQYAIL